ncbi:antibiotic biosynthesis monooxygenase [Agrobacterium tumefaciens]|uniref:putative quinol monooxygenase n=1 Tax=Agrobacterium tumefaciens TaxID=358 RepID=UPI0012B7B2F9|nr:putative quinol monooxygenase [Agrobacterium tumefaciens]MQB04793.1 antibiotic biosynthesis monooxygenase [Agrobacterium tumefaciens]
MIGMMVELRVAPGSTDAFERAFAVQAAAVRANEPRTRLYELFKSRTVADSYTLIEIYEDEAALSAHRTSSHMVTNRPLTEPFLAAPPVMHIFEMLPITAPMLQLHGANDGCILSAQVADGHRFTARHAMQAVPDVGHFLHIETSGSNHGPDYGMGRLAVFQPYKNTRTKLLDDRNCVARAPRTLILIPV